MDERTPLIETRGLKKYFSVAGGKLHAVDDVNLKIYEGQTLGVVGESGCGKSTLGRTILRLIEPTEGEVYFRGENICKYSKSQMRELRKKMQIIFQDPYSSINPRMTVEEIIEEYMIVNHSYNGNRQEIHKRTMELWIRSALPAVWRPLIRMSWTADAVSVSVSPALCRSIPSSSSATSRSPHWMFPFRRRSSIC